MGKDNIHKKILKKRKKKKKIKALKKKRREEILRNTPRVIIDGVEIQYDDEEKEKGSEEKKSKKVTKKKVEKKKVKKESNLLLFLLPIFTVLVLIVSFTSFLFVLFSNSYEAWEEDFEKSEVLFLDFREESVDLEDKIQEYNKVTGEYSSIALSQKEALFLISQALDESLPDWASVQETALDTSVGNWNLFVKIQAFERTMPWLNIEFSKKKDIQSVDIYVEDLSLGDFSLKRFGFEGVVENVNGGVQRALQLVNDGNFAGRVFENIELGEEELIIKSRNILN